jgi:hypothetical protein
MTADNELEAWREEWTSQAAQGSMLADRVKRHSRFMRLMLVAEVLVTVVIGGGTIWLAVSRQELNFRVLAAATWLFLAAAWGFGLWNRHGAWSPVAMTSAAYIEISIRRCRSAMLATIFGMVLYVVELVFCLVWIYQWTGELSFLFSIPMGAVAGVSVVFFVWSLMYRKRKKAELARLIRLAESMA